MINFHYTDSGEFKIDFICDVCKEKIKNLSNGIVIFDKTVYNKLNEYQIVHHGTCAENEKFIGSEELKNIKSSLIEFIGKDLIKEDKIIIKDGMVEPTIIKGKVY